MYRIGVVGPSLSIERILNVAREIEQGFAFIAYPYTDIKQVKDIVLAHDQQVDYWLFSGYIPFMAAQKVLAVAEKTAYIFSTESSIYKSFMELVYSQGRLLGCVSIDMFAATNAAEGEGLQRLGEMVHDLYVKTFAADADYKELYRFHYDLWRNKNIEGVLTCFPTVYEALDKVGVPVQLMTPTRIEIFQTLRIFFEKIKTSYYKDTQIGVAKIELNNFDVLKEKLEKTYAVQYLELRIKGTLIEACEKTDGSLIEDGGGRYTIFSSRGAIEREIHTLKEKVQYLTLEANTSVAVGIGFGKTVLTAEINAHRALQHSKKKETQAITIVQDDGTVIEAVGQTQELTYAYRSDDAALLETLKAGKISVKTFQKIAALLQKMGSKKFTTKDLAANLQMSERNAQGIVAKLCSVGLAACVGEEAQLNKGRPSKIYCLK